MLNNDVKYIDLFRTALSVCLGLDSPQCSGEWPRPHCTLFPYKEAPDMGTPKGTLVLAVSWGHCRGQGYHWVLIYPKTPWPACPLKYHSAIWLQLETAGETVFWQPKTLSVSAELALHIFILMWLAFSSCLSVMCLVPGEHSTARWTLISECSEREGFFSSFEDSAPL